MAQTQSPLIYERMAAIMLDAPVIGKGQKNRDQGFMFRGIDDLYTALHNIMAKHQVFTTSEVLASHRYEGHTAKGTAFVDCELTIRWHFWAVDGSSITSETVGVGRDYADKYASKALAIAHKYALVQVFSIPTNEPDNDPDHQTIQGASTAVRPESQRPAATRPERHWATDAQIASVVEAANQRDLTEDQKRNLRAWLNVQQTSQAAEKTLAYLQAMPMLELEPA